MSDWAIIFDVDGVLLELTRAEEELFFQPFARRIDADQLSRDWNSYKIRNDEDIVKEIVTRYGLPSAEAEAIAVEYLALLEQQLQSRQIISEKIAGADEVVEHFAPLAQLGIATANFRRAAELRLHQAGLWEAVSGLAHGADGGGHKSQILARAIAASGLPKERIIFIGDNVNDVTAGLQNGVHFIGFSADPQRLTLLKAAGAKLLCSNHFETTKIVRQLLNAAI